MSEPPIFFSEVNERQGVFHRRAFLMGCGAPTPERADAAALFDLPEVSIYWQVDAFAVSDVPPRPVWASPWSFCCTATDTRSISTTSTS